MTRPLAVTLALELASSEREALEATPVLANTRARASRYVSTYFDTADHAVCKSGHTLCIRHAGGVSVQSIQSDIGLVSDLVSRPVWERVIDSERPELRGEDELIAHLRDARLIKLFAIEVDLTVRTVTWKGASLTCDIATHSIHTGRRRHTLSTISFALQDGPQTALFGLARHLADLLPLRLAVASPAEHGYRSLASTEPGSCKAEAIPLAADDSAEAALQLIIRSGMRQFRLNETELIRNGAPEALHQARVGLRRMRTAFSLHRDMLGRDEPAAVLTAGLKRLAGTLGTVRDLDVLLAASPRAQRTPIADARQVSFLSARAEIDSPATRTVMIALAEWLTTGHWRTASADPPAGRLTVCESAEAILERAHRKLKRRGRNLGSLDDDARHAVRIAAKKLRYALDFFSAVYAHGKRQRRRETLSAALSELQDRLGTLNDRVNRPRLLTKLGIAQASPHAARTSRKHLLRLAEKAFAAFRAAIRCWR